ncbi:MAG TPA: tetratricopeptide repeat protein [Bryobacteraceae bacterium]|nr:tetratricopeptide repeat protein [Bryobacteraceae bacterium]
MFRAIVRGEKGCPVLSVPFFQQPAGRFLLLLLIAAGIGCSRKTDEPKPHYAILRFENLSGNPSLDWTGRAASEILTVSLAGALDGPVIDAPAMERRASALGARPPSAPGISAERAAALLAGATRLVSGYVTSVDGKVRVTAVLENPGTGKTLRTLSAEDASPAAALRSLSRQFSPSAKPYLSSDEKAIRLYTTALDEDPARIDRREEELREALASAPNFGPGWLALVQAQVAKGDQKGAEEAVKEARSHQLDPVSIATLDEEDAELRGDKAAVIAAQRRLVALSPGDTALLRGLAEREMAEGQFAQAAADWKQLSDALPGDASLLNTLGYARAYAGDYQGAVQAFDRYGARRPADPNVEDSRGDLAYEFRKFRDAASHYMQAYAKDPNFLRGGDLYKAAWAKFRGGDKAGADASFAQFKTAREKLNDPTFVLIEADWLYRTGRQPQAIALLRKTAADPDTAAQVRSIAFSQLAIWDLLAGDRAKAKADADASGTPSSPPLAITHFVVLPSASAEEWKNRASHMLPGIGQLRETALAYALLFDGKPKEALPYWQAAVKSTPATDFYSRTVVAALEGKKPANEMIPDPNAVNQFAGLLTRFAVD